MKTNVTQADNMTKGSEDVTSNTDVNQNFPIPAYQRPKLSGFEFYEKVLGSPKYVVAPMVDASELAWRILCRRHGAQLCYSPMYHSSCFIKDIKYRTEALQSCPEDRPFMIQFCGNDPKIMLEAALIAQDHCDGIDINLGCPQAIAKRGRYGAFLQDEWELLAEIVSTLHQHLQVPVTCKIRIFDDESKTIKYAQMLESAGAQIITVHGRTREMKGPMTGIADWEIIRKIRESVNIPVFANGNICCIYDVKRCMEVTGVNGVMSAEGNLHNPFLFDGVSPTAWDVANEYLNLVELYPCPKSFVRGHLFKIFHHLLSLKSNANERLKMANAYSIESFREVVNFLHDKYRPFHEGEAVWDGEVNENFVLDCNLTIPPWICQPYYRPPPAEHKQMLEEKQKAAECRVKEKYFDKEGNAISKKHMKKLKRLEKRAKIKIERHEELCTMVDCANTRGLKCDFNLCRICCKKKCFIETFNCSGHKVFIKDKRERAQHMEIIKKKMKPSNDVDDVSMDVE
ncbi:CLUMA_CG005862, isoform A [Clunio marinus]|uniref:tRNA-dihydrouridine(16/17) synthase [NAD(P)(+)]-like n=1 Tax=Clunio marinus TaxID=568069 RepID=A0A1J1I0F0_9DIPT|nr:CLUMA_CG005862, isoform A [Clunio marinus]